MTSKSRRRIAFGATAATVAALAGGAYAATQSSTPDPRQVLLNDVANRLHVSPAELSSALRGAVIDQLQAAVKAGRLTQADANRIEQRIRAGAVGLPLGAPRPFGPAGFGPRLGHAGALKGAADFLGLTDAQLLAQLAAGKTLAQIAQAHSKSVDGLRQALVAQERRRIERAAGEGLIPKALAQQLEANISSRVGALLSRSWPRLMELRAGSSRGGRFFPGPGGWPGGAGASGQTGGPGQLPGSTVIPIPTPDGTPPTT